MYRSYMENQTYDITSFLWFEISPAKKQYQPCRHRSLVMLCSGSVHVGLAANNHILGHAIVAQAERYISQSLQKGMQAIVGYQLTEEVARLYCNKQDIGRFHDVSVLLSGRKRSWQAMMDSPSGDQTTVEYIASSQ